MTVKEKMTALMDTQPDDTTYQEARALEMSSRIKREERYTSRQFAETFDRLRREHGEHQPIMTEIRKIHDLQGACIVELGAGTGVTTQKLAAEALSVAAFDRSPHMLAFARQNLQRLGVTNCFFAQAEHSHIPLPESYADVVLAAWALDRVIFDSGEESWRSGLDRIVLEMRRLTKNGGTIIIVATPLRGELDYQEHLERAHGFERHLFKSLWRFSSKEIAREVLCFFLQEAVWKDYEPHWPGDFVMPTGIWWKKG
jgi:ubiquinone/menaquinone biosynthesis C-methylase UbiE